MGALGLVKAGEGTEAGFEIVPFTSWVTFSNAEQSPVLGECNTVTVTTVTVYRLIT